MKDKDMASDCIKYCLLKAKTGNVEDALHKISKALGSCEPNQQSIRECITLLKVLQDEE